MEEFSDDLARTFTLLGWAIDDVTFSADQAERSECSTVEAGRWADLGAVLDAEIA